TFWLQQSLLRFAPRVGCVFFNPTPTQSDRERLSGKWVRSRKMPQTKFVHFLWSYSPMNSQLPRRSMSQALQTGELPAEALALIKEGAPQPKVSHPIIAQHRVSPKVEASPAGEASAAIDVAREQTTTLHGRELEERATRARSPKEKESDQAAGAT